MEMSGRQHPQTPPSPTPSTPPSHTSPPSVMEGFSRMSVDPGLQESKSQQQSQPQSMATPAKRPGSLALESTTQPLGGVLQGLGLTQQHLVQPTNNQPQQISQPQPHPQRPRYQQQQSMPVTRAEFTRADHSRTDYNRSNSRTEALKQRLKQEAAMFFGVHEESEKKEQAVWMGRRRRLASRKYGNLKPEYQDPTQQPRGRPRLPTTPSSLVQVTTPSPTQPDVLLSNRDEADSTSRVTEPATRQKPSVARMTLSGVALVMSALNRHRTREPSTEETSTAGIESPPMSDDEVFFNGDGAVDTLAPATAPPADFVDHPHERTRERHGSWKRTSEGREECKLGPSRIDSVLNKANDNSNRRAYGMSIIHRIFGSRTLKRSVTSREPVKEQLEDLEDHRPFFTYWVTTVQILILVISIACYGLGPIGFGLTEQSGLVLVTSLSLQQVDYTEPASFWLGPRAADLIHLGAKFAPCMRKDAKILKEIDKSRERERETACCIRNDDSGCVQSSKADCSKTIATWKKWTTNDAGPGGRISGSVCGLDPKYCEAPASIAPYEWPDDITKWPICRKTSGAPLQKERLAAAEHMVCEVIGHPCCIGIHAHCKITTKEYCDFVHGHFHDEASLCSQVSCLDNVCGMMSFYYPDTPDQFYRLFTSLFLHAGILHLMVTIVIQWFWMRDLEKLTGPIRIMIIYLGSGIGGNLASAIFVPYRADVGPAGSQFGLLACYVVEVWYMWPMLKHPKWALGKLLIVTLILFLIGLLPWVDNFSHLFGFLFGLLLSCAFMPFVSFGEFDRQKKIFLIWVCIITTGFLFLLLVLFFYIIPVYDCEICNYLNCIPLTRDFCNSHNINFKRPDHIV